MSRFIARIFSAAAICIALSALTPSLPARAATTSYLYQHHRITFSHVDASQGITMVGIADPGLRSLIKQLGAIITWHPGRRYVLITTSEPEVISFSVGNRSYDVGPVTSQASVAPFARGQEVYLPLDALLHALYLAPKADGPNTILQPQLGSIDVRAEGDQATLVAHGGVPFHSRILSQSAKRIVYAFDGVGSTLQPLRNIDAAGIRTMAITNAGSLDAPRTLVTLTLAPGATHGPIRDRGGDDFAVAFAGPSTVAQAPPQAAALAPPAAPTTQATVQAAPSAPATLEASAASNAPASVGSVVVTQTANGASVTIPVSGNATYQWHRLRAPDNRFWVDIENAKLATAPVTQAEENPLLSLRVRQDTQSTVRIALSLSGQNQLDVSPSATGLTIAIGNEEVADAGREGSGSLGTVLSVDEPQPAITPAPLDAYGNAVGAVPWKFGPHSTYVPTNPRLIVIDPGHGGSDPGSERNGTKEATLTLEMAKRLRTILLARGWQVQMTRTTDVDVYEPNDSAHDELQARVNVANQAGARLFVSIHVNAFINSGPHGTTTYYSKPEDQPLARIVQHDLAASLGTKDDGIVKSHLYVTLHSYMPAILVETAFLSNPDDYALLVSPAWRQRVAEAIADGIDQYTQQYPVQNASGQ